MIKHVCEVRPASLRGCEVTDLGRQGVELPSGAAKRDRDICHDVAHLVMVDHPTQDLLQKYARMG